MKDINKQQKIQKVAIYIRVSTEEQVEKFGRDLQESAIRALIQSRRDLDNKLVFAGKEYIYVEEGVSGTKNIDERPEFARLKEDIISSPPDNKPFDIVAVYKIDRFARKLKILLDVIEFFEENNIKFLSVNESIDTSTPFGKAMLGIIGVIAELEIETTKERTRGGREEAAKKGVILGNASMFGYKKDKDKKAKIFKPEAKIVKLIFDLFLKDKLTLGLIAKKLKLMQILSPEVSALHYEKRKGKSKKMNKPHHWTPTAIRRILSSEIYIGNYYYNKSKDYKNLPKEQWKLSPHPIPQIIDNISFEKVQRMLKQIKHERPITRSNHIYLLSGLLVCDACYDPERDLTNGMRHWVGTRKKMRNGKYTYTYNCGRKNKSKYDANALCLTIPLPAEEIEKYIINFTKKLLKNPLATFEYQNKLKSTQKGIEHLKMQEKQYIKLYEGIPGRKSNLREQHKHGYIDMPKLKEEMDIANLELKKYEEKIKDTRKSISENTLSKDYSESLELFSNKYKLALNNIYKNRNEIYQILHTLIEEIVVYSRPRNKKDTIAGIYREKQEIPHRLHIKLKLPQEIVQELSVRGEKTSLVGVVGLEPTTSSSQTTRASQLRHTP